MRGSLAYTAAVLKLSRLCKRFGERMVLNAVSLEVDQGEYVAIVGESGIGKSTLLNVIAGLEAADSGSVLLGEEDLGALDDDALTRLRRDRFGFVFQAFHVLPHLTVLQNVGLPLLLRGKDKDAIDAKARQRIEAVGLKGREQSLPRELSGGELQRVAIARALVGEPQLVLADEPTGNLDPDLALEIMLLFKEINSHGTTVLVATHDRELIARMGKRVVTLDRGRLVEG